LDDVAKENSYVPDNNKNIYDSQSESVQPTGLGKAGNDALEDVYV
jgi:hypothetical protein